MLPTASWPVLFVGIVSVILCVLYFAQLHQTQRRQGCTQKTTAVLTRGHTVVYHRNEWARKVRFTAQDGREYETVVPIDFMESAFFSFRTGEQVPVWYDPEEPELVIIGEDPTLNNKLSRLKTLCRVLAIITLAAAGLLAVILRGTSGGL